MTRGQHHATMDALYPGWDDHLLAMTILASIWLERKVYDYEERDAERMTMVYEELYLGVSNATPNKPPLVAGGKEITV